MAKTVSQDKLQVELVKLLYKQLSFTLWAESLCAIGTVAALWDKVDVTVLWCWLAFNLIVCGLARHVLVYYFHQAEKNLNSTSIQKWLFLFGIGAIFSAISWGAAGWMLMVKNDLMAQSFLIFLLLGITAAGNLFYSANRLVYALFLIISFSPLTVWLIIQGGPLFILGLLAIVYMMIMLVVSYLSHAVIKRSIILRFENDELVINLKERSASLEKTLSLVNATLESTHEGILAVDSNNKIENFNHKFIKMMNISGKLLQQNNADLVIEFIAMQLNDAQQFLDFYRQIQDYSDNEIHVELLFRDGRVFEYYSHPQILNGECVGHVLSFRDISRRKLLEQKLFHKANYDSLTELPNRALLLDRFSHALAYAKQSNRLIAIFFLDIDHFKLINDTLGHSIGDKLLMGVAKRLKQCISDNDTVSREGGDEFIIMMTSLTEEEDTISLARRCLMRLRDPFLIESHKINISTSIGISFWPKDGRDAESLIKSADIAMYRAKELGRNNFQFFTEEMNKRVLDRLTMENRLRNALEQNEFSVLYQPIVSLKARKVVGLEALLRWQHPLLGAISPADFIPIAEESGLIVLLGEWVLRTACAQIKEWQRKGMTDVHIAVNLSSRQFKQANFFEQIEQIILGIGIDPHCLTLELTESIIMEDIEKNIILLNKLKKMGVLIVLDDFGVGYSSLSYLKRLPVDKLKIDRSFVEDVPHHSDDAAITAAIIALAGKLNLQVIAEGVENEAQVKFLIKHYCDEIQGFYFYNALDADSCLALLRENVTLPLPSLN